VAETWQQAVRWETEPVAKAFNPTSVAETKLEPLLARTHSEPNGVANRTKEARRRWYIAFAARGVRFRHGTKDADDFRCGDAHDHAVHRCKPHHTIRTDDEDRRFRDAPLFDRIVDVPLANNAALYVAQNSEWQA